MDNKKIDEILDILSISRPKKETPRQYNTEEVRDQLFTCLGAAAKYWGTSHKDTPKQTIDETLYGMITSVLAILDGEISDCPRFIMAPTCSQTDKEHWRKEGKNWWAFNNREKLNCEITEEPLQKGFAEFLLMYRDM
jgi:hypothetical protein